MYEKLAQEMMRIFERKGPVPPRDRISTLMRGEMAVLRLLEQEDRRMTAGEICRLLDMKTPRIAAVLGSLEKKGLIDRSEDAEDRRRVIVSLNDEGKAICLRKKKEAAGYLQRMLERLGEKDAQEFVRLMCRVHEIMPEIRPPKPGENENMEDGHE